MRFYDVPHPWLKGVRKLVIMKRCTPGKKQVLVLISIVFFGISLLIAADDSPTNDPASSPELKQIAQVDESFDTLIEQRKAAEVAEYLKKAKEYYDNAEFTFALINYERALRLDKPNVKIQQLIEECKLRQAQQKALLAEIPLGAERDEYVKEKYKEAQQLYRDKAYEEAKNVFEQIWIITGDYRAAKKYLKRIKDRLATSETPVAVTPSPSLVLKEAKEKAAEEERKAIASHLDKAEAYLKQSQLAMAKAEVRQVFELEPRNRQARALEKKINAELEAARVAETERLEAERKREQQEAQQALIANLLARGNALQANQEFKSAIAEYERILSIDKNNQEAKQAIAQAKTAAKTAAKAAKKDKERAEQEAKQRERAAALIAEGDRLFQADKFEKAIKKYKEALELDAENTRATAQLAIAQEALATQQAAVRLPEEEKRRAEAEARKKRERNAAVASQLKAAEKLLARNKFREAIAEAKEALNLDPANVDVNTFLTRAEQAEAREQELLLQEREQEEKQEKIAAHLRKAKELLKQNGYADAIAEFEAVLKLDAANAKALAGVQNAHKSLAKAEARATKDEQKRAEQEAKQRERAGALIAEGDGLFQEDKFERAIKKYKEALELGAENTRATAQLAIAQEALAAQQAAVRLPEEEKRRAEAEARKKREHEAAIASQLKAAENLLARNKFREAIAEAKEALKLAPANVDANAFLAKAEQAEAREQERLLQEREQKEKKEKIAAHLRKAEDLLGQKSYEEAIAEFEAILKLDPKNKALADALAGIQDASESLAKAEEAKAKEEEKREKTEAEKAALEKAKAEEEAKQKEIAVHINKAEALLGEKSYADAIAEFEAVLKLDAANAKALTGVQNARKSLAKAEEAKAKEERKKAEVEKASLEKAKAEEEAKQKEIEELEKASLEQAKQLTAQGIALFDKKKYEEALERFDNALALEPLYSEAVVYKGRTEVALAQIREEEERKRAEQRRKEEAMLTSQHLTEEAKELLDAGKYDEAQAKLEQAVGVYPENKTAKDLLAQVAATKAERHLLLIRNKLADGERLYKEGAYNLALEKFQEVLQYDPKNAKAARHIRLCNTRIEEQRMVADKEEMKHRGERAEELFKEGLAAYEGTDIETAVAKWREALAANPDHLGAQTYLEQTRDEYERFLARSKEAEDFQAKEKAAQKKLDMPVTISTTETTDLKEFLRTLSLATGINFYVAEGVEASVFAKFDDIQLREILDTILLEIGLKWSRKPGTDIITVTMHLQMKVFSLTPEEITKVRAMMETKFLQRILWPPDATPKVKGVELRLDEREALLISTDSKSNIERLDALLKDLKYEMPPSLIYRSYTIRPELGPKIKALIEGMLQAESRAPYSKERKLLISEGELIVKDTPENIKKIEELLEEKTFIAKLREDKIRVETYNVAPAWIEKNPEQVQQFGDYVVEVIETMLYAKTGRSAARQEGRRLWYDRSTMQLTVTDYPDNLKAVSKFLASLPMIEKRRKSEIIFLKHVKATDLADQLRQVLGLEAADTVAERGISITKSVRVEDVLEFRDLRLRVVRVNENNINDDLDDSVELVVNTPTTSQDMTIEEFRSEFIDDYEISAPDIRPSGTPGEGRAKLEIRYLPPPGQVQAPEATPTPTPEEEAAAEALSVDEIETLNALLIRYEDPAQFAEVAEWIERLDIPVLQVSIEVRFVEVIESRAKEYSSEFTILNLGKGVDLDSSLFNMRFAQDMDEFRSEFEPGVESTREANLLKGTTIFNWIIGGGESPVNYQLRLLEAEGIINIVSSPNILVLNGETADFEIDRQLGLPLVDAQGNFIAGAGIARIDQVDLSVSPTITQLGSIMLDIDAEIYDFDHNLGALTSIQRPGLDPGVGPLAVYQGTYDLGLIRKDISTTARLRDGQTIVLGGWAGERSGEYTSGVPILRNLPFLGKLFFGRNLSKIEKTTLLIFLTGRIVD